MEPHITKTLDGRLDRSSTRRQTKLGPAANHRGSALRLVKKERLPLIETQSKYPCTLAMICDRKHIYFGDDLLIRENSTSNLLDKIIERLSLVTQLSALFAAS